MELSMTLHSFSKKISCALAAILVAFLAVSTMNPAYAGKAGGNAGTGNAGTTSQSGTTAKKNTTIRDHRQPTTYDTTRETVRDHRN
jgi:hypothetical protein